MSAPRLAAGAGLRAVQALEGRAEGKRITKSHPLRDGRDLEAVNPANSWMLAAAERNLPIIVPGWEDSTMGNIFASYCIKGELQASTMKSGIEYMG